MLAQLAAVTASSGHVPSGLTAGMPNRHRMQQGLSATGGGKVTVGNTVSQKAPRPGAS